MTVINVRAFIDNYIWMLINKKNHSALCVDPGDAPPVIQYLNGHDLTLKAILLTHHHADHIGGVSGLLHNYPKAKVYAPDDPRIGLPKAQLITQSSFSIDDFHFEVLPIPGHTATHICFYETNIGAIFCGDTLFSGGCGRVFDGTLELLFTSLLKLKNLPDETKIYCGHEYTAKNLRFAAIVEPDNVAIKKRLQELINNPGQPYLPSTIVLEKKINPFLRVEEPSVIAYARAQGCVDLSPFGIFKQLRADKDVF